MTTEPSQRIEQHDAAALAGGYSRSIRRLEVASIGALFALMATVVYRLLEHVPANPWMVLLAVCSAYLGADLLSGIVHWMGDTWSTPS
ncbi:MAG TPA: carotenoid synthesis regulator CarF, partial [Myxococcales bacterium]|nr:carotenoid synthesis regulator CarF [Myxococcales bacterium]